MNPETGEIRDLTEEEKRKPLHELFSIPIVPISDIVKQQMEAGRESLNRRERRGQGWRCLCRYFNDKQQARCQHCGASRPQ